MALKIFVTGGTGFIGEAVSLALRRKGHTVYALARNEAKAKNLVQHEVNVVVGDLAHPESYIPTASQCDVLIHAAADYSNFVNVDSNTVATFLDIVRDTSKKFIYTSGCLVYNSVENKVNIEDENLDPNFNGGARVKNEQLVTAAGGVVLRPGFVYGHHSGFFGSVVFTSIAKATDSVALCDANIKWAYIHVDDLADAYVRAAEGSIKGEVFNVSDDSNVTLQEVTDAVATVFGKSSITVNSAPEHGWLNRHCLSSYAKLHKTFGWTPSRKSIVDEIPVLVKAWQAYQN
eukprot:GILK01000737.1.p1 GENE.GILK01000737.1~~GILK01000737.1.p1  ORF type:complete len:289 (+),score=39.36 GILK01000737.1:139-1005(+)